MLIELGPALKRYNIDVTGVIHAGAHYGQEYDVYRKNQIRDILFFEPCKETFSVLENKLAGKPGVKLYNLALGQSESTGVLHVENSNQGQSNSLLAPKDHCKAYPDIKFSGEEQVEITTLNKISPDRKFNMLCMDVQGFEKFIIAGASEVIDQIDIIYTEVNRAELYSGCTLVQDLDQLLPEFKRVETHWTGEGWGDAIYIRRKNMVNVPDEFRPHMAVNYPIDNELIFEEWFFKNFRPGANATDRTYLPVFWTSYYVNNNYGRNKRSIDKLQAFLRKLDPKRRYFTVVQYDDGILNDLRGLDIKVFASAGPRIDYPIALMCKPHPFPFENKREIKASFVGHITHQIRGKLYQTLKGRAGYYIYTRQHDLDEFCQVLSRSIFTLCPRGYGQTSFRICEALQYGSIPVYISDEFIQLPDFEQYGLLISPDQIDVLDQILTDCINSGRYLQLQENGRSYYQKYYTYQGTLNTIASEIL